MTAYVLLSGGIDSTTCLYIAHQEHESVVGVSIDYGQRHKKEMEYARESCARIAARHHILDLSSVIPNTMLTDESQKVPDVSYDEIKGVSPAYVPFRNGLMLSALTSYVAGEYGTQVIALTEKYRNQSPEGYTGFSNLYQARKRAEEDTGEWAIYFGAHSEDARNWAYPDCTPEFIGSMANAIFIGTYQEVRLYTPLQWLNKQQIIELGTRLNVNWSLTWSCYKGGEKHCGVCPTCRSRRQGFLDAHAYDPTEYEQFVPA